MKQFSQMANFYFLMLTIAELIPAISDSGGYPVLAFPLSFVVVVSMIKDIYEDYFRHKNDDEENERICLVQKPTYTNDQAVLHETQWASLQVG